MQIDGDRAALPVPYEPQNEPRRIRVLSVDDDKLYCETLLDIFTEHGFDVRCFPDAASFLETLDAVVDAVHRLGQRRALAEGGDGDVAQAGQVGHVQRGRGLRPLDGASADVLGPVGEHLGPVGIVLA